LQLLAGVLELKRNSVSLREAEAIGQICDLSNPESEKTTSPPQDTDSREHAALLDPLRIGKAQIKKIFKIKYREVADRHNSENLAGCQ
jgi:hypothetical protein